MALVLVFFGRLVLRQICITIDGIQISLVICDWYESNSFFDQTTLPGNQGLCGNRTSSRQSAFETAVSGLLSNLSIATPKINGFYAAATAPVNGTSNTTTAYAIAQCAESVTPNGCRSCMKVAFNNIRSCATDVTDGRAVDSGCFMRYSATAFFRNNQTSDIVPFLLEGETSTTLS
ncbi:putative non-specific serine/threonine protein kinase [Helianthus anomalus]